MNESFAIFFLFLLGFSPNAKAQAPLFAEPATQLHSIALENDLVIFGEIHFHRHNRKLFLRLAESLLKEKKLDAIGTEVVLGEMQEAFQKFLNNRAEDPALDKEFYQKISEAGRMWADNENFRSFLKGLQKLHLTYGVKICAIDDKGENREETMAALAATCIKGQRSLLHMGTGHCLSPDKVAKAKAREDLSLRLLPTLEPVSVRLKNQFPSLRIHTVSNIALKQTDAWKPPSAKWYPSTTKIILEYLTVSAPLGNYTMDFSDSYVVWPYSEPLPKKSSAKE